jgi:hypothetical protein
LFRNTGLSAHLVQIGYENRPDRTSHRKRASPVVRWHETDRLRSHRGGRQAGAGRVRPAVIPLPARDLSPAANGLCGLAAQFDVLHFHMGLHHFPLFSKSAARDDRQFCGYRPARASARSAHPNIAGAWRLFRIPRANLLREIDYVTAPIALELLRAKVRVFVELYRLRNDFEERVRVRTAWLKVKRGTARSSRMQTISSLNSISICILPRSTDWWLRRSSSTTMKVYCKLSTRRSGRRSSVRILGRRPR